MYYNKHKIFGKIVLKAGRLDRKKEILLNTLCLETEGLWSMRLCSSRSQLFEGSYILHIRNKVFQENPMTRDMLDHKYQIIMILNKVRNYTHNDMASHPRRHEYSATPVCEPQIFYCVISF